jgi:hypothetical protein
MALQALPGDSPLREITTHQLLSFFHLAPLLRRDILLAQPNHLIGIEAPAILPPSICDFLADSLEISSVYLPRLWELFKEDIWALIPGQLTAAWEECFVVHGWKRGLSMSFKVSRGCF